MQQITVSDYPSAAFTGDPVPLPEEPVAQVRLPSGDTVWLVSGYDEVRIALAHPLLSRDVGKHGPRAGTGGAMGTSRWDVRTLQNDGAAHGELRRLAARPFTPRRVEGLRRRVQELTDGCLDAMEESGPPADLLGALAQPLPIAVIMELFAVPERDREDFVRWSDRIVTLFGITEQEVDDAHAAMRAYLDGLIAERRARPGDDLLSGWLTAQEGGDRLSDEEVNLLAQSVLIAGFETTVSAIGAGMWRLFQHPEQLAAVRADRGLLRGTVEEILRHQPMGLFFSMMVARGELELGGVTIRAGEAVMPLPHAANRDAARFADPARFDIRRANTGHLGLGHGPHSCLGAALARIELEVAIGTLNRRFPGLRPVDTDLTALAWRGDRLVCGLRELPVRW
ncbi:cytochrome P450 [Streptomyces clavuligerus]|uniref:cytochrome P450 n=1 Tax=Streptomyces clavuligerus TaxID=1901 RepID=UPI0018D0E5CB|nr:cytochrome P450 [Streptomyces clavuligerus]